MDANFSRKVRHCQYNGAATHSQTITMCNCAFTTTTTLYISLHIIVSVYCLLLLLNGHAYMHIYCIVWASDISINDIFKWNMCNAIFGKKKIYRSTISIQSKSTILFKSQTKNQIWMPVAGCRLQVAGGMKSSICGADRPFGRQRHWYIWTKYEFWSNQFSHINISTESNLMRWMLHH